LSAGQRPGAVACSSGPRRAGRPQSAARCGHRRVGGRLVGDLPARRRTMIKNVSWIPMAWASPAGAHPGLDRIPQEGPFHRRSEAALRHRRTYRKLAGGGIPVRRLQPRPGVNRPTDLRSRGETIRAGQAGPAPFDAVGATWCSPSSPHRAETGTLLGHDG